VSLFATNLLQSQVYQRALSTVVVALPPLGFIAATLAIVFWERKVEPLDLGLLLGMYVLTFFGITAGYHRLFTHRAFQTGGFMRAFLAIAACMTGQGTVTSWVSHHRCHHLYSDEVGDVHSPNLHGEGVWGVVRGIWHVHIGWIDRANWNPPFPYVSDILRDRVIQTIDRFYIVWVLLSLLIPTVIGGVLTTSWAGALRGFLWGGAIRLFLVHQVTFGVNSICHLWGIRRFSTDDRSTNNPLLAIVALGEGWHHNHHAFPNSAKMGLTWWQLDLGWVCIVALQRLGLVWNVKVPSAKDIELKQNKA
jgi:stearoyl-CoA desaturase (Delta-9 desaturase)